MLGLFRKELRDLVRQPRALLAALLYPLLVVPLLGAALDRGAPAPPCLRLSSDATGPLARAVTASSELPSCRATAGNRLSVAVARDAVLVDARDWRGPDRDLQALVARLRGRVASVIAERMGIDSAAAATLADSVRIVSKPAPARHGLAMVVPLLALFLAALGAVYPALESGVGERETGTLLGLLQSPLSDAAVVAAKAAAAWVCACLAVAVATAAAVAWLMLDPRSAAELAPLTAGTVTRALALVAIAAMPLAVGALLASLWSRSIREAQQYVMILVAAAVLLAGSAIGVAGRAAVHLPVADAAGALAAVLSPERAPVPPLAPILLLNGALALALGGLTVRRTRRLRQAL